MAPVAQQGYLSLLRWRSDPTRDEARNVAVLVVVPEAELAVMRAAPLHSVSPRLHDQGIIDDLLIGLERQFQDSKGARLLLDELHETFQRSLEVTAPQPIAIADPTTDVAALYRAFLAQRGGGARTVTKGVVRDRVTKVLRDRGINAVRGQYVDDFLFDIVIADGRPEPTVIEVLSFAGDRKDWTPIEYDAGHFLFGRRQAEVDARAVVNPPAFLGNGATKAYDRISRWFAQEAVPTVELEAFLEMPQGVLDGIDNRAIA